MQAVLMLGISYQSKRKIIPASWLDYRGVRGACRDVRGPCHGGHGGRPYPDLDGIARTNPFHEIFLSHARGVCRVPGLGDAHPPCAVDAPLGGRGRAGPRVARPRDAFCQSVLSGAILAAACLHSHLRPFPRLRVRAPSYAASPASAPPAEAARARAIAPQRPSSSPS